VAATLLLASNSPRRRELLQAAGFEFASVSPDVTEHFHVELTLREITALNATRKGLAVARAQPHRIVLAADTLVAVEGEVIGKPADLREAAAILRRLSGKVHDVCSAVFVCHLAAARSTIFHELSQVRFRRLSDAVIQDYFKKIDPLDKAGAYAAQGGGAAIIQELRGSYSNVVGLPMEKTTAALAEFGIVPRIV
jgi:septum formation protein